MPLSAFEDRLRHLEKVTTSTEGRAEQLIHQLDRLHAAITTQGESMRTALSELDTRVRHIEQSTARYDLISETIADLRSRLGQLETNQTSLLAREQMASRGVSWVAAIVGGLIASAVTGAVGAVLTRLL